MVSVEHEECSLYMGANNVIIHTCRFFGSDAVPPKIFVYPPRSPASTTVHWWRDTRRHQQRWSSSKFVYSIYGLLQRYMHVSRNIACSLCDSWTYCNDACSKLCRWANKNWQLLKVLLRLTRDLFALFVQQQLTTFQLIQSVARSLGDSGASCYPQWIMTVFALLTDLGFSSECSAEHNPRNFILGAPHWHNILQDSHGKASQTAQSEEKWRSQNIGDKFVSHGVPFLWILLCFLCNHILTSAASWSLSMILHTFLANVNLCSSSLYAIAVTSVCLSSVCNVGAPYSAGCNFRQFFSAFWYFGHPLTLTENFTEIVPGEPLHLGI